MTDTEAPPKRKLAIKKTAIFNRVGYHPHAGQVPIHKSRARHRVASCGRRFGKSQVGGHELIPEAFLSYQMRHLLQAENRRREFWIVGPEYSDAEKEFRVFYNDCVALQFPFDKPGTYNNPESGQMTVSLWDGRFIVNARSAKYPNSLVGEGLSGVELVEAAKLKPSVWTKYLRPALADYRGWSLHTSTPEGKNWFYEKWQDGQDPSKPDWASWRRPSWMNPFVFPDGELDEEILAMAVDMTEEKFNQEVRADFTDYVGKVFKEFDEEIHVRDIEYNPRWPLYVATDYGFTNPFVVLFIQVDIWDNVYVIGEYYKTGRDTGEVIKDIQGDDFLRPLADAAKDIYPEPADPGTTKQLASEFRWNRHAHTGGEIKDRLELIRKHLKLYPEHVDEELREPKLLIDRRRCPNTIREMGEYRYPENKSDTKPDKEQPMDVDDHTPEALGRFFRGYFGKPDSGRSNRAKISKAKVRSGR